MARYPVLHGLGAPRAKAAMPAESRVCFTAPPKTPSVGMRASDSGAVALAMEYLARMVQEEMHVLALSSMNIVRADYMVGRGAEGGVNMTPSAVLRSVLMMGRNRFALVHNHPGGDPEFSPEDWKWTANLISAAKCAGLQMVDHLVVAWDDPTDRMVFRAMRNDTHTSLMYGIQW